MMASEELAEPDDAPITPGSRRRRPRRIAAAEEDSDGEGAVTPAADEIMNSEFMRLATTCSSDGTPTGPWHGGGDGASRPWHGGGDLAGAEAEAESEPDPTQIAVHELKIAPQPQHVRACLRRAVGVVPVPKRQRVAWAAHAPELPPTASGAPGVAYVSLDRQTDRD